MRIIAGSARGRRLFAPGSRGGESIRPTADRAREALFNILGWETVRGAMVLDLFAGTGALGLEALSRGATAAVFVDNSPLALDLIHKNITACGFADQARVIRHDLLKGLSWLQGGGAGQEIVIRSHLPRSPYRQGLCAGRLTALLEAGVVGDRTRVIFEDDSSEELPESVGSLRLYDRRAYGDTGFWLYETTLST